MHSTVFFPKRNIDTQTNEYFLNIIPEVITTEVREILIDFSDRLTAKALPLKLSTYSRTLDFNDIEKKSNAYIPESSPLYPLQNLQIGWDGYWAEPLSEALIERAQGVWDLIKASNPQERDLPIVSPGANASVAFSWTSYYPSKELEIWLYDQPEFYVEWLLSNEDSEDEGTAESWVELSKIIKRFQKL